MIVKLLKNGQSEQLLKALHECVPGPNQSGNIDLSSLHYSLRQAEKTTN
jgi:hypothetical protein